MQEVSRKRDIRVGLRARVPLVARVLAIFILTAAVVFIAISYYKLRNNKPFRMRSEAPELSKHITGRTYGYEQRVTKDGRLHLLLKAAVDLTYSDGHHELETVSLAVYPPVGEKPDQISANRAIYDAANSLVTFLGSVKIETKDALKVDTESMVYNQTTEVGQTDAPISFSRENLSGSSTGAVVDGKNKKLELNKDVLITVAPEAKGTAQRGSRSRPISIRSARATFEQPTLKLSFYGGVTADQERDTMSGNELYATLNEQKRLQKVEVRGNSYLSSREEGRAAEVQAVDMDFFLDKDQRLERAVAMKDARSRTLDSDADMTLTGANLLEVKFEAQGERSLLREMRSEGRSVITLAAPKSKTGDSRAANKRLTADAVKLSWRITGRDLEKAEAVGNGELFVDPVVQNAAADRKTLTAPRFDCDFFEAGNLARTFVATGGAKAVIEPVIKSDTRGVRTLTGKKIAAVFVRETQDVERMEAQDDAKFNENDRNGVAANISYVAADDMVRMRGGEPTVWDARARTKAVELDSNLRDRVSYSRGKTATTYYSQEQTNGATPFRKVKSPVYVVSDRGEFHHDKGIAIYTGNARAWQDDNFVRGDKLTIYINEKKMDANGRVQSAVYNARRNDKSSVPVFATADSMSYSDPNRLLHYESNVDIRQGSDRITSGIADVHLRKDSNEMEKTVAQKNVVLTQPNRKGSGDWVEYTTSNEVAVLKGNPARVEDSDKGNTEGARLTVYMREDRVVADDPRGPQSPGRVRSTHKVKKN
ncbi:MAG TPA: LPS export ABC transporter periplasmic protein LptC [Pyrinomonadaceae bacterium]|nr:LPS export ABC transporter periplasmic protein LptC [Pyrinomonadaceae bacterium]